MSNRHINNWFDTLVWILRFGFFFKFGSYTIWHFNGRMKTEKMRTKWIVCFVLGSITHLNKVKSSPILWRTNSCSNMTMHHTILHSIEETKLISLRVASVPSIFTRFGSTRFLTVKIVRRLLHQILKQLPRQSPSFADLKKSYYLNYS